VGAVGGGDEEGSLRQGKEVPRRGRMKRSVYEQEHVRNVLRGTANKNNCEKS